MLRHHLTRADRDLIHSLRNRGIMKAFRQHNPRTTEGRNRPVAVWFEEDVVNGSVTGTLATVISTPGCAWGREGNCSMCGYFMDSNERADILEQFAQVMERAGDQRFLKIYTSGSFLDPAEVAPEVQERILSMASERFQRVLIESRPEFITRERLDCLTPLVDLEVAIGLETASDDVRNHSLNKGFSFDAYRKAADIILSAGVSLRTYLLLKPPFMSEGDAIRDAVSSIEALREFPGAISVNPMNIQNFTLVDHLYRRGEYQPPALWSLLEVLRTRSTSRLMSSPSGGGTPRGAHNCGNCDRSILEGIRAFSLDGNVDHLEHTCTCRDAWTDRVILEDAVQVPLSG